MPAVVATAAMAAMIVASCADDGPGIVVLPPPAPVVATTVPSTGAESDLALDTGSPVPVAPNGQSVRVQSLDNTFRPDTVEITAGTEVVFTNDGRNDHDVIASDGAAWGVVAEMFAPGNEYRHVFTLPGEYPYYCSIHGTADFGMIGTIVVTG
ncbi:hypothetical protein BH23ACT3_BH23ACT3_02830 [soil metagenome]